MTISGAGDLELVGDEWGEPDGVPVMLLHGGGQNRHAWKGTAARLAAAGHHVLAIDARGHGDSGWDPLGRYDMPDFADDVVAAISYFENPPAVVGASMGGTLCVNLG